MNLKTAPLILSIFALVFALPAASVVGAAIPAAIAQEEDDTSLGKDLAGGILTDIFDGSIDEGVNDDAETGQGPPNAETVNPNQEDSNDVQSGDDTNTQIAVPIIDQDQGAANLGANLAANLDVDVEHIIEETRSTTPPEEEEQPPEGTCDPFTTDCSCFRDVAGDLHCFPSETECILFRGNTEVPPATECVKVGPG